MKDVKVGKKKLISIGDGEQLVALRTYVGTVDLVVTDPSYVMGDVMNLDMECPTGVGDWCCDLVDGSGNILGKFSADCGFVSVTGLGPFGNDDVEKWASGHPDCVAFVRKFRGTVALTVDGEGVAHVRGIGKSDGRDIAFESRHDGDGGMTWRG